MLAHLDLVRQRITLRRDHSGRVSVCSDFEFLLRLTPCANRLSCVVKKLAGGVSVFGRPEPLQDLHHVVIHMIAHQSLAVTDRLALENLEHCFDSPQQLLA
jgi:hypothetical protein